MKQAYLEILCDFADKTLEGQFADQELCRLLVPSDLTKSDCAGAEAMGFLDATSRLRYESASNRVMASQELLTVVLRAAEDLAASCLRGALPPVDLRAVCFVRAIEM